MLRYDITTLGCKVNQYESHALGTLLGQEGLLAADAGSPADLVVVNTCVVTSSGMSKSRQAIRRSIRRSPGAVVLVTGCYTDYDARRVRDLLAAMHVPPERQFLAGHHGDVSATVRQCVGLLKASVAASGMVASRSSTREPTGGHNRSTDFVLPSGQAADPSLPYYTEPRTSRQQALARNAPGTSGLPALDAIADRQRAFVKIQDGCDAHCTYCIVAYNRPVLRSRGAGEILDECRRLIGSGHREIVLCGVFLGAYGRSTAIRSRWGSTPSALPGLLRQVAALPGIWRVRLSSLEPADVTDELLEVYRHCASVAPHLHLPMQSGSAAVLARMNRQYTPDEFRRSIGRLGEALDEPALTADVIAGFPGETEEDFERTLELVAEGGFCKVHAFPFSAIRGTAAWNWREEAPPVEVVRSRLARLGELEGRLAEAYRRRFVGQVVEGLVEGSPGGAGRRVAMTDRYLRVQFAFDGADDPAGEVVRLEVTGTTKRGLMGRMVEAVGGTDA